MDSTMMQPDGTGNSVVRGSESGNGKYVDTKGETRRTADTTCQKKEQSQDAGGEPKDGIGGAIGGIDRRGVANQGIKNPDAGGDIPWDRNAAGGFKKQKERERWSDMPPDNGGRAPGNTQTQGAQNTSTPPPGVKAKPQGQGK